VPIVEKLAGWSVMVSPLPSSAHLFVADTTRRLSPSFDRAVRRDLISSDFFFSLMSRTITLTILPSLSSRRPSSVPSTPMTSTSYEMPMPTAGIPPASFLRRLAQGLAEEFDYLLHWDLPISTMVEFNEVGMSPPNSITGSYLPLESEIDADRPRQSNSCPRCDRCGRRHRDVYPIRETTRMDHSPSNRICDVHHRFIGNLDDPTYASTLKSHPEGRARTTDIHRVV
jgi:hypothetical protein